MTTPIIIDGYCRVSTDPQEENYSLDEQERCIREYCASNGFIVGIIHREVWSGYQYRERDKLSLVRERYQTGKIQGVVVRTFDRLSRKQVHVAVLMEEMEHFGAILYSVKEDMDAQDPMSQFIRMVLAFVAEMEREKIMDRTMTGRTNAVKQGNMKAVSARKLRYGYQWADTSRASIILNEAEADIVRWMAESYADGTSSFAICQILTDRGVPSPSGKDWRECTIIRTLSDRRITGESAQVFVNKAKRYKTHHDTLDVPDGTFPAIISTELFERIQHRMEFNKAQASRCSKAPEEFLLRAGYVRCSVCGWGMGAKMPSIGSFVYRCRKHGSIASKALDTAIWSKIEQLADHVSLIEQALQLATDDTKLQRDMAAIEASIERWQRSAANYLGDLEDSNLTGESRAGIRKLMNDANIMVNKLEAERAQLTSGLFNREREEAAYQEILGWCKTVKEARGKLSYQRKRDFLDLLGVVVTVQYDKAKMTSAYDMYVRLPALQALISLPETVSDSCNAHTVV